jgi:mannose/fructose-specific phosphotransferase system component IIA
VKRFRVRELVMLVVIAALSIALAIQTMRAHDLAVAVELGDREFDRAADAIAVLNAELEECQENAERIDAELQVREAADQ